MQVIQFKVLCHIYANFAAVENIINKKILIRINEQNYYNTTTILDVT